MLSSIRTFCRWVLEFLGIRKSNSQEANHLETLNDLFRKYLVTSPRLRADSFDKFVVLGVNQMVGLFDKYGDAVRGGYRALGSGAPFLVQQVGSEDVVAHFLAFRANHLSSSDANTDSCPEDEHLAR